MIPTFAVGEIAPEVADLLGVTKEGSFYKGVAQANTGNRAGDVPALCRSTPSGTDTPWCELGSRAGLESGDGRRPEVPNYGARGRGPLLKEGMVICIEPMINMGARYVVFERDGWTVRTKDRKPSAHFEFAVAVRRADNIDRPPV